MRSDWQRTLIFALKAALGAAIAIALASLLGLGSAMTAGIITILSLQSTRRATWRVACERLLAFVCATGIALALFSLVGYTLWGFAAYLFVFSVLCLCLGWTQSLAPVSVLVTHYVAAGRMDMPLVANEALLLVLGAGVGLALNLHLRPRLAEMEHLATEMDAAMVAAVRALADDPGNDEPFQHLHAALEDARRLAEENQANRILGDDGGAREYVHLRASQERVLRRMRDDMRMVACRPTQYEAVCALLRDVAGAYHRDNDVAALMAQRQQVLDEMKRQSLPATREEFESRAVLYNVLLQLEEFLLLKREYHLRRLREQREGGRRR